VPTAPTGSRAARRPPLYERPVNTYWHVVLPPCAADARPRPRRTGPFAGPLPILTAALLWGATGTAASLAPPDEGSAQDGRGTHSTAAGPCALPTRVVKATPATSSPAAHWPL
jgi:hypothetical protein